MTISEFKVYPSTFGGSWIEPFADSAREALSEFFDDWQVQYMFEPWQAEDLANYLHSCGLSGEIVR